MFVHEPPALARTILEMVIHLPTENPSLNLYGVKRISRPHRQVKLNFRKA